MGELEIVVDRIKIDYKGPVDLNALFRFIEHFLWERGFDKKQDKDFEFNTDRGKFIEWQYTPWKKISDYVRYIIKVHVAVYDSNKIESLYNGKKVKVDNGRVMITIDAYIEYDYDNKWDDNLWFEIIRGIYDKFVYKIYTERFEQRLVHDVHHLHHEIQKFLNMYKHFALVTEKAP